MKISQTSRLLATGLVLSFLVACTAASPVPTQPPTSTQPPPSTQPPSKASTPAANLPVKFGWQVSADFPFLHARASGGFEEAGLAPEFVQFNSGREMLPALQSKSIDVAGASDVIFNVALAQGLDVKVIYVYEEYSRTEGLVARADSGIQKVGDLAGKRVAYTKGSSAHYAVFKALAASGLSPEKLTLVDLGPDKAFAAFLKGDIDAWWVWQPWLAKSRAEGGKLIVTDRQVGLKVVAPWFARTEWLGQNPEAARRLALVASVAADRVNKDKSLGVKPMAKAMAIPEEMASEIFDQTGVPTREQLLDEKSEVSMTSPAGLAKALGDIGDFLYEQKIVPQRPEPSKAIDPGPMRAALQGR